jgi:hypothetical protein
MATAPENPPAAKAEPPEGMRYLDDAVGGDLVPIGPLGGPAPKTREEMLAEQEVAEEASEAEERKLVDAAKAKLVADKAAEGGPLS